MMIHFRHLNPHQMLVLCHCEDLEGAILENRQTDMASPPSSRKQEYDDEGHIAEFI